MREKELRLALICYGGVSLAVYMHGITKEIWRMARASRAFHDDTMPVETSQRVYRELIETIEKDAKIRVRAMVDIVAGASAGGINGIFLANAIATGKSLDPLTDLWLEKADVDVLLAPDKRPLSRFSKFWATPIAWALARRKGGTVDATVDPATQDEVSSKLSRFVRAKWFQPPFSGEGFTRLLLDGFAAMEELPSAQPLLPDGQPLDLFVTVTDFHGHNELLKLNSPPQIMEKEHRLIIAFHDAGEGARSIGEIADLTFAARATASFPGAFPPFNVAELDKTLAERGIAWPTRTDFLTRTFPRRAKQGRLDEAVLIDGSVLVNAPFSPAIQALTDRPARREVDRRIVYIDPRPDMRGITTREEDGEGPGFFRTVFGAVSDIPREQPIRDNLDAIEGRSRRIRRMRRIVESIRPEIDAMIEAEFGRTLFLNRPTAARLSNWRKKAQERAALEAGYAYMAYGQLKLSGIVEDLVSTLDAMGEESIGGLRDAIWGHVRKTVLDQPDAISDHGANESAIAFFREHDLPFRIRRLRALLRRLGQIEETESCDPELLDKARESIFGTLSTYLDQQQPEADDRFERARSDAVANPGAALAELARLRNLRRIDDDSEAHLIAALGELPKPERRTLLLAYLGFPFVDIATLPLLDGEGLDEFDPVKVDRIAPEDARAIREGGSIETLKGIEFNSFGAFFSRSYRENDYLWGRLHGADRLIDIIASTVPADRQLDKGAIMALKKKAFQIILDEENERLTHIPVLFEELRREVDSIPH